MKSIFQIPSRHPPDSPRLNHDLGHRSTWKSSGSCAEQHRIFGGFSLCLASRAAAASAASLSKEVSKVRLVVAVARWEPLPLKRKDGAKQRFRGLLPFIRFRRFHYADTQRDKILSGFPFKSVAVKKREERKWRKWRNRQL